MAGEWGAQILKLEAASHVKNQLQPQRLGIKTNTFRINTIKQTWKVAEEQTFLYDHISLNATLGFIPYKRKIKGEKRQYNHS